MPYSINKYDGTTITVVEDGTINTTTDLKLVGKDYPGYGEIQNENFVFLMENFAGNTQPPRPLNGQLWFDAADRKIKVYDKLGQKWRSTGSAEVSDTTPVGLGSGDFWWDSREEKLYISKGNNQFSLIGPENVYNFGITHMRSRGISDNFGSTHAVIEMLSHSTVMNILSSDAFTLHPSMITEYGNRFSSIKKGLNLPNVNSSGVSTVADIRYWGTSSDSDRLGGKAASEYALINSPHFFDSGFTVGNHDDLAIYINSSSTFHYPIIMNKVSNRMYFYVKSGASTKPVLALIDSSLYPGEPGITDIGTSSAKFDQIYANKFNGVATNADTLKYASSYITTTTAATPLTVAVRDSGGNLTANLYYGVATQARYADLAEKYIPDREYEVGTVMKIGGEKEITAATLGSRAIGVISENPAYMMNCDLEDGVYVALKGRVPVKVYGKVSKGDQLIAGGSGYAVVESNNAPHNVFAIALESTNSMDFNVIEAIIL